LDSPSLAGGFGQLHLASVMLMLDQLRGHRSLVRIRAAVPRSIRLALAGAARRARSTDLVDVSGNARAVAQLRKCRADDEVGASRAPRGAGQS